MGRDATGRFLAVTPRRASRFITAVPLHCDMNVRRSSALAGVFALLVLTTGCLGLITGSEPAVFTASEAGVSDAALSETDFQHEDTRTEWANRSVSVAGQERDVRVQNYVSTYRQPAQVDVDEGITFGYFVVAATPQAQIAGQALNPIGGMSPQQMVDQLTSGANDVNDVQREDERTLTILGSDAQVTRFSGTVERQGQQIPVYVEVTRVQDGDDFVVAIGGYPQENADSVRPGVTTLFEGVEH